MRKRLVLLVFPISLTGCALGGSWRTESIRPEGAPFPVNEITFDPSGKYTATGLFTAQGAYDGDRHTTTGGYKLSGAKLTLSPTDGPQLVYNTVRRLDGKLVMTLKLPNQDRSVSAVLAPARP